MLRVSETRVLGYFERVNGFHVLIADDYGVEYSGA